MLCTVETDLTQLTYLEKVDKSGTSPAQSGFSVDGGRSVRPYYISGPSQDDLIAGIQEIIGGTTYAAVGDGRLVRTPPLADPVYPWLYATSVPTIVGVGGEFTIEDADPTLEVPPVDQYPLYPGYFVHVEFKPRPYAVSVNDDIQSYTETYYPINDAGAGNGQTVNFYDEWIRYVDFNEVPTEDYVTAQMGQMEFVTNHTLTPDANNAPFPGSPRIFLPNSFVEFTWYQVPLRLLTSSFSYIKRFRGRINQTQLNWPGGPYAPGEMLYLSYKNTNYTPPVQQQILNPFGNASVFSTDKLTNITLRFLRTNRYVGDVPTLASLGVNNRNYILGGADPGTGLWNGGHNALPWLQDRQFHIALTTAATNTNRWPSFLSAPLNVLFTDPDCDQVQSGPPADGGFGP